MEMPQLRKLRYEANVFVYAQTTQNRLSILSPEGAIFSFRDTLYLHIEKNHSKPCNPFQVPNQPTTVSNKTQCM